MLAQLPLQQVRRTIAAAYGSGDRVAFATRY